jgi:hypothetical protein
VDEREFKESMRDLTYAQALRVRSALRETRRQCEIYGRDNLKEEMTRKLRWWTQMWAPQLHQRPPWYRRIRWTSTT